jgi:hypothetical protein
MKLSEVINNLEPDCKSTIEAMVSKAGLNGDATIDQLASLYPHTDTGMTRDERLALVSLVFIRSNRFAPKLDFPKRCEILALYRKGLTRDALSSIYNVDRRTITHIYNPASPHYKNVRQAEIGMGTERFQETYLTPDALNKALAFIEERKDKGIGTINNKHANKKAGIHTMRGEMCSYDHRVMIQWREDPVPGWYYCDLDGDFPDKWFTTDENSCKTSQACYVGALRDIADKLLGSMA